MLSDIASCYDFVARSAVVKAMAQAETGPLPCVVDPPKGHKGGLRGALRGVRGPLRGVYLPAGGSSFGLNGMILMVMTP